MATKRALCFSSTIGLKNYFSTPSRLSCKLLVCGGGAGGCSIAAKFASKLGPGGCVVVEPSDTHYYQSMWTMVGGGLKTLEDSGRPMGSVLPIDATWLKDSVVGFQPEQSKIFTAKGTEINYEYMVIALGLDSNFDTIPGLREALENKDSGVCSNYHPNFVNKTHKCVKNFKHGTAIFTCPNGPLKCIGATQSACYVTDAILRKDGKRINAKIKYIASLPSIFGAKKYADCLCKICDKRGIDVELRTELIEIRGKSKEAVFRLVDNPYPSDVKVEKFELLHICPPMSAPAVLKKTPQLSDAKGFLSVDKETLQHNKFKNVFGIGDCANLPTSKTVAAIVGQNVVLAKNIAAVMENRPPTWKCEFQAVYPDVDDGDVLKDRDKRLPEAPPADDSGARYFSHLLKKNVMPLFYWHGLLKGRMTGQRIAYLFM